LIVLAGLPGSGKSTIAREVARRTGAIWLRVDSMDQAIWASGTAPADLHDWTYRAAQAVAEDNLRLGRDVIGDCVNDWKAARDGWQDVGRRVGVDVLWLEIICTDPVEHQRRVETRASDVPGLALPDWQAVLAREYHTWDRDHLTIDTAGQTISESVEAVLAALSNGQGLARPETTAVRSG
jgi:predicted kinase